MPELRVETEAKKRCSRCRQNKGVSEFNRKPGGAHGVDCYCRECKRTKRKRYRLTGSIKRVDAAYRARMRGTLRWEMSQRLTSIKIRSKRKGLKCELSICDLVGLWESQGGRCAVSGMKMSMGGGQEKSPNLVSIDRIHPPAGYTISNVRLVVWAVNAGMQDWGTSTYLDLCLKVVEFNGLRRPS